MLKLTTAALTACMVIAFAGGVYGQNFPVKPIRLITAEAGGGLDFAARLIAQSLSPVLGEQVVVDNRGGGSGSIAAQAVAKAPADGYTLLFYSSSFWLLPFMRDNMPYDPVTDFVPITLAVMSPNVVVVHPSVAANSVKELIALAKARPGELNYASSGGGSSTNLAAELLKSMASVDIVHVPYTGGGPAVNALVGGQVQLMIQIAPSVMPQVKAGRLRALAVTSAQPSPLVPGLPTVAATLPGYESVLILGVYAPAKTPPAIVTKLNEKLVQILNVPDVKAKFFVAGSEVIGSSSAVATSTMMSERARMGKIIKQVGIRAD